jgi:hypothetical protein
MHGKQTWNPPMPQPSSSSSSSSSFYPRFGCVTPFIQGNQGNQGK